MSVGIHSCTVKLTVDFKEHIEICTSKYLAMNNML